MAERKKLRYGMVGGGSGCLYRGSTQKGHCAGGDSGPCGRLFQLQRWEKTRRLAAFMELRKTVFIKTTGQMAQKEAQREDGIDFVSIVTPNATHYQVAKAFLEAGIHVACEKPLCFTVEQAEELQALCGREKFVFCCDLYLYRICHGKAGKGAG